MKSFPNYAAVGYDIANYFIPYMSATGGDFNRSVRQPQHPVQSDIELKRVSNWGGFFNPRGYILSFGQGGDIDKIDVR